MDAFRNFVKGWPGKILMILFSVPFALLGIESYFSGSSHQGAANVVNGQPVSKEALDAEVKALQQGYLQMVNGDASLLNQEYIEKAALDNLVSRMLLTQQANELGLSPSEEQVKQMIVQNTQLHENGAFSQKKYDTYLQQTGQTNQGFIAAVRDSQALQLLSTTLGLGLVNPNDVNQLFKMANEQRHLHLASVNLAEYKTGVQASDAEIQKYYDEHQVQFMRSAQVDVDYIVVSPSQLNVQAAAPTEEELQQAYQALVQKADKKVKHILVTTQGRSDADAAKRAAEAYAKIQAGESFAQVAKNYSEDTDSNAQGGVIADYTAGAFSESFDQAVNAAKVGQVTQPVKTNFGYHLIVVDAANVPSFASQKATLTAQVQKAKTDAAYADAVNKLNETVVSSDSLDVIKQEVKGSQITTAKAVTVFSQDPILGQAAVKLRLFGDDVKSGEYHASSNLALSNGDMVWVKVRQYTPAAVAPLANVKEQVKAKVIEQKAVDAAKAKLQSTLDAFKTQPAQTVLATSPVRFQDAGNFVRGGNARLVPAVQNLAFSLLAPKQGFWSVGTTALNGELIVVAVSDVKQQAVADESKQKAELLAAYTQNHAEREIADYLAYLKAKAKIEAK